MSDSNTEQLVRVWLNWIRTRDLDDLVPADQVESVIEEAAEHDEGIKKARKIYDLCWEITLDEIQDEDRTIRELLNPDLPRTIVNYARTVEPTEETVRIMLRNDATEAMFGKILYEGITEFINRVDIIGKLMDQLPLIGGIKGKIENSFPEGLQALLEGQIKKFLGNFSGAAAEKAMNFVLSPQHINEFTEIQGKLVSHFIDKPPKELLPSDDQLDRFKESIWATVERYVRDTEETQRRFDRLYEEIKDEAVGEYVPSNIPDASIKLYAMSIDQFLKHDKAREWFEEEFRA